MEKVELHSAAYTKIILHGAKYPAFPIIGILVGQEQNNTAHVHDIIPVYHSPPVGALFDIALLSISTIYDSSSNWRAIGLYFSTDRNDSDVWPHYINKLIKAIQTENNNSCLTFQLKNSLLENMEVLAVNATSASRHPSVDLNPRGMTPKDVNEMINILLNENYHRQIHDLEDHTDQTHQTGADFRNGIVDEKIREYLQKK